MGYDSGLKTYTWAICGVAGAIAIGFFDASKVKSLAIDGDGGGPGSTWRRPLESGARGDFCHVLYHERRMAILLYQLWH